MSAPTTGEAEADGIADAIAHMRAMSTPYFTGAVLDAAEADVRERVQLITAERDALRARCETYENDEGGCCPEDVGFVEYIAVLQTKLAAAEAALARVRALLPSKDSTRAGDMFGSLRCADVRRALDEPAATLPQDGGL